MQEIQGKTRTVRELLSGAKYGIDYYQREYKWQTKQMVELVSDLTGAFLEDYQEAHQRADVANYGHYFLGSIVISQRKNEQQSNHGFAKNDDHDHNYQLQWFIHKYIGIKQHANRHKKQYRESISQRQGFPSGSMAQWGFTHDHAREKSA